MGGWLVVLGLTALSDNVSVYIGSSSIERENEERNDDDDDLIFNDASTHRVICV